MADLNDDIEEVAALIALGQLPGIQPFEDSSSDEERAPRRPNKNRDFDEAFKRFQRYYFKDECVYSEADFERRFRMPRALFERLEAAILGGPEFRRGARDATGKLGIDPRIKLIAVLRVLGYGTSFDQVDEVCEIAQSTTRRAFLSFINIVKEKFGPGYLRKPKKEDLVRILAINDSRGFPGCMGSWDCQHWSWKNCPIAWVGQHKGKESKPTIVLEAVADGELYIWGCNFGHPGSMNDLNILDCSTIVEDILKGELLPDFSYTVNGVTRTLGYWLVDGIYPKWAIFVDTIQGAVARKQKTFAGGQEAVRKDVERAFGVLLSRWHILAKPAMFHDKEICKLVMECCIILHNMIVEARRDGYESELFNEAKKSIERGMFLDENGNEKPFTWKTRENLTNSGVVVSEFDWAKQLALRYSVTTDELEHYALKNDLVEHVWNRYGMQ